PRSADVVEAAEYPSDDRLARDRLADEIRIAQRGRGVVGGQYVRNRRARRGGALLYRGLQLHAGVDVVGRAGTQDQGPPLVGDGVERPCGPAGTSGERAQVLDAHIAE